MTTLYLTEPGTVVRYHNQSFLIKQQDKTHHCRLVELTLVVILPGVQFTDEAIAQLLDRGIETIFLKRDGQFRGRLQGQFQTNPTIRLAQYRMINTTFGMALAQLLVMDQVVISLIQGNLLQPEDFQPSPDGEGIWLGVVAKKLLLGQLERRLREPLLYRPQNRKLSLSQIMLEQARSLARCLVETKLEYEGFLLK